VQTIKTAAIVVLMLTVLYGGYVSLTTPPEPLPDEIEEYLVINEAGDAAFGGGTNLAAGLELSQPPAGVLGSAPPSGSTSDGLETGSPAETLRSPGEFGGSFADLPPKQAADSTPKTAPTKLPSIGRGNPNVMAGPADAYASTPDSFRLPDPSVAASSFDPSRGTPFPGGGQRGAEGTEFQMTDNSATALDSLGGATAGTAKNAVQSENRGLINAFATADAMFAKGQLKEALATLSVFYGMPNLSQTQRGQLLSRLDPLAREVIYSRRHLLEQPHRVGASETLVEIASRYDVPWELLANVNQVKDPVTVLPGTELKMIRGPFRAEVDLTGKQMTLYLGDLYAGRFEIEVGNDPTPAPGTFTVQEKQTSHVYYDRSGTPVPAGSPENPYGNMWMDLGGQICIHGSPNTVQPSKQGCISVAGDYADDVYGILSQGSSVTIRR
jgi:lipoprotein-anchoring transpeptidase ErfK/SrfK